MGLLELTNTICFIEKTDVPVNRWRDVTYRIVGVDYRPEKSNPYCTRLTVGGDRVRYPGDSGTPTVDFTTLKIILNCIVSTPNAKFMIIDEKYLYLNTPMAGSEYMRIKICDLPKSSVQKYNLVLKATKYGYIYVEIKRGMYGLRQAGIILQQLLEKRLNIKGYRQSDITPVFWTHDWCPICFFLCVDDFGVKYVGKQHADHLMIFLREHYKISRDWKVKWYLVLDLYWD